MSDKTILSQRLNEQLNGFRKSMDEFAESCTKIIEKYGLYSDETECEQPDTDTISKQQAIDEVSNNSPELAKENGELISRQAVLDAFGLSEKTRKYGGDHSGYDTMMLYEIQDVLENLPPSPSRPQWIPCSERLPDGEVLCCDTRGEMIIGYPYQDEESSTGYGAVLDDIVMIDCTAWMPLPKPYQGN